MENKPALYLNMIVGDFEPADVVKRSIDSVKNVVDGIYVTLTYKDEPTPEDNPVLKLLTDCGAQVSLFKWTKNFAEARNFAMSQVPKNPDTFIYWQDADDVLVGAEKLRDIVNDMVVGKQSAIFFDYWYQVDLDEKGNVREILVKHKRERIIRHDDTWKWVGDLHETLINQRQENIIRQFRPDCYVVHLTSMDRLETNIDRNIEILESSLRSNPNRDPRMLIYLAKAYFDKCKMEKDEVKRQIPMNLALNLFHEYLNGHGTPGEAGYQEASGWKEERSTAWQYIAEIAILSKHPEIAINAYQNAIDEAPQFPNYYIDMAMCYVLLGDFDKAKHWLLVGTQLPEPNTTIIQFPREIKSRALETAFHLHMHYKSLDKAVETAKQLVELFPNDEFAKQRLQAAEGLWTYNRACQSVVFLGKYLESIGKKDKIPALLESMPEDMQRESFAAEMRHIFLPPKVWGDKDIAILCGPGFEKWGPESIEKGIGGSEEAVIRMAAELAKLGWKPTVYGAPEKEGIYDGVEYKEWHNINQKDQFNILILWRSIGFVDVKPRANYTILWLHDVPNNPDFTEERLQYVDKIAVLSEYHKSLLRMQDKDGAFVPIPDNKVFLTANGIPALTNEWKGSPTKMFYASSPDRGLPFLLQAWPEIKKQVPEAELHIYYGFQVYDAIHANNPARLQWKNQVLAMMQQDGIIYHGRVGHDKLHEAISECGVWVYPTDFTEISCITAMKAQALGAIPVVTNYAALEETVKNGFKVDVDIRTKDGQEEFFKTLVAVLKDPAKQEEIRPEMIKWARSYFLWENVARSWDQLMRVHIQNPALKYEAKRTTQNESQQDAGNQGGPDEVVSGSTIGQEQVGDVVDSSGDNARSREDQKVSKDTPRRGRKKGSENTESKSGDTKHADNNESNNTPDNPPTTEGGVEEDAIQRT